MNKTIQGKRLKDYLKDDPSLLEPVSIEDIKPVEQAMDEKDMEIAYISYLNVLESLKA